MVRLLSIRSLTIYGIYGQWRGFLVQGLTGVGGLTTPRARGTDSPIHPYGHGPLLLIRIGNGKVRHPPPLRPQVTSTTVATGHGTGPGAPARARRQPDLAGSCARRDPSMMAVTRWCVPARPDRRRRLAAGGEAVCRVVLQRCHR